MINCDNEKFSELVLQDVLNDKGWLDDAESRALVSKMSEMECFDAWLETQGIFGMGQIITDAHAAIKAASST